VFFKNKIQIFSAMINTFDICISFGDEKILFDYDENISFQSLLHQIAINFNLAEGSFKIIEIQRNARIISSRALDPRKEYRIELLALNQNPPPLRLPLDDHPAPFRLNNEHFPLMNPLNPQDFANLGNNPLQPSQIELNYFNGKKFSKNNLLAKLNSRAGQLKFKIAFGEGRKPTSKGYKRTIVCSDPKCKFRLVFESDAEEKEYCLNLKLSSKYNQHSKIIFHFFL